MRPQRVGEAGALADLVARVGEGALQLGLLELIDERGEGFDERDARAEEHRELLRRDPDLERGDAAEELAQIDLAGALLGGLGLLEHLGDHDAVALEERTQALGAVRVLDAFDVLPAGVDPLVGVDGHLGALTHSAAVSSSVAWVAARTSSTLV